MPTGQASANLQNKQIVGSQDLGKRLLDYMKLSHEDATQARFDVDGAVSAAITGAADGNDTLVFGTGKATDGIGHILDFTQLGADERTVSFPNATGVTYRWAAAYAQEARGIRVSPRTGAPQYVEFVDQIGERSQPNSVIDNGNGTITLVVDSVTEAALSHAGKKIVVWLVVPQSASEAVAVEVCVAEYSGGNNRITTVGNLGQSTISTNPADYVVLARGVSFRANPFPAGFFILGQSVGNGPAAAPNALDTATQRLLKTFQDASQISSTAYGWIAATNIQSAIEEIVNDLGEHTTATAGAVRIGVNPNDFSDKMTQANHQTASAKGGVGSISDGTFSSTAERQLDRVLAEIDRTLRNRYTHLTYGSLSDSDDATGLPSFGARQYHIRPKALSPGYVVGATNESAKVVGEQGDVMKGTPQRLDLLGPLASSAPIKGEFERVLLTTNDGALGQEILSTRSMWLRRCGVELGGVHFASDGSESFRYVADCDFHEPAGLVKHGGPYGLRFSNVGGSSATPLVFERTIFRGSTSLSRTQGDLHWEGYGDTAFNRRPLVFRDCTFLQGRGDLPILTNSSVMIQQVLFENCVFISTTNQTVPLVDGDFAGWKFKDCFFYAWNGDAIKLARSRRSALLDCYIKTGNHSDANPIANRQILSFSGEYDGAAEAPCVQNLTIEIGRSVPIISSGTGLKPLIRFGNTGDGSTAGPVRVNGLHVHYTEAAAAQGQHKAATILFDYASSSGTTPGMQGVCISNVVLDLNGARRISQDTVSLGGYSCVAIFGHGDDAPITASNVHIVRAQMPSASFGNNWLEISDGVHLSGGSVGPFSSTQVSPATIGSIVRVGSKCRLGPFGIRMECPQGMSGPAIQQYGESSTVHDTDVHFFNTDVATVATPIFASQIGSGIHSIFDCEFIINWAADGYGIYCSSDVGFLRGNTIANMHESGDWIPLLLNGDGWNIIGNRIKDPGVWLEINGDDNIVTLNTVIGGDVMEDGGTTGNVTTGNKFLAAGVWP